MDQFQPGKMKRGEREEAIRRVLKERLTVPIKDLIGIHHKSSVYFVLNRLKERGEGRYVKVEQNGKLVSVFQYMEKVAPHEEVKMVIQLLSSTNPPEVRREAAKDLFALVSKYETIPEEGVDFLLDNWHQPRYADVQGLLLETLWGIAVTAKAKGFHEVVDKVKCTADKVLEVAKDFGRPPGLRECAWGLLILLEEPRIRDAAFELLAREEEQEGVMGFVREEVKRYAEENPLDAKRRLYDMLRTKEGSPTHQRILCLLQAIRYPSVPTEVPKVGRYTVARAEGGER